MNGNQQKFDIYGVDKYPESRGVWMYQRTLELLFVALKESQKGVFAYFLIDKANEAIKPLQDISNEPAYYVFGMIYVCNLYLKFHFILTAIGSIAYLFNRGQNDVADNAALNQEDRQNLNARRIKSCTLMVLASLISIGIESIILTAKTDYYKSCMYNREFPCDSIESRFSSDFKLFYYSALVSVVFDSLVLCLSAAKITTLSWRKCQRTNPETAHILAPTVHAPTATATGVQAQLSPAYSRLNQGSNALPRP